MNGEGDDLLETEVWRLCRVREALPTLELPPIVTSVAQTGWPEWRTKFGIPIGTPYLISPAFEYDIELNEFFYSTEMLVFRMSTRVGYARDIKGFLTFLHRNRGGIGWRDASEEDHRAYLIWRREDPAGPRVGGSTWDREVSGVNRFFRWQGSQKRLNMNPIPQRPRRAAPGFGRHGQEGETAATYSHDARRERIRWFPAKSYRQWRDVGVRGYGPNGLPDAGFRGRWAARNSVFVDLMVRTGLRLTEQASLTPFELPQVSGRGGYQRFWLPASVAKAGSARWIYVPSSVLRDLAAYAEVDRREMIDNARAKRRYRRMSGQLLIVEHGQNVAFVPGATEKIKVSELTPEERRRLFVDGPDGLEPAAFWLNEYGMPMSVSTWKDLFRQANARCAKHGLVLHGHAHLLRHTFSVLTLEQLQRGHIAALAQLNSAQRGHYTRIFGDPLDWVRRRLGHKSVTTTQIYLHALEELEMETRMALISDDLWEDPRDPRPLVDAEAGTAAHG
ncbi:tyrosine-type recombinase/integrase [Arthrobacter sp. U41]|uniref:tyrosine-type recombinase/integrase n=1 Tax=Arthrobacter sp. U41 TaxID=1849032 RepID=UPI0009F36F90|nr:site-specific integrase [Arthrobacter sp. U41]